jgi:peptidoglycan hydrolase-like protein with peptidoglycan-binding domain
MPHFETFSGNAKRLDPGDYGRIGKEIGVGEDELKAFIEVESRGKGFDEEGRPIILTEPHVFYRNLPRAKRAEAVKKGLAYPKWGSKPYPRTQDARYEWLEKAMEIDSSAALKACSWGLTQILGENYKAAGYDSVEEMVTSFMDDEENHLLACVNFLETHGLDDDLRAHRWEAVARGYNGAGYRKNKYHTKLKAAYAKYAKLPDYIDVGSDDDEDDVGELDLDVRGVKQPKLPKYEIMAIQKKLRELGFYQVGKVDGFWGPSTTGAIAAFQAWKGLPVDGTYGPKTKAAMSTSEPKPVAAARALTTVSDLRAQGSEVVKEADKVEVKAQLLGGVSAGAAVLSGMTDYLDDAWGALTPIKELFSSIPVWIYAIAIALVCYSMWRNSDAVKEARLSAEKSGMHNGEPDPAPSPPVTTPSDSPRVQETA